METGALLENTRRDLLHRFTPTPIGANFSVMGRTVRLETNSYALVRQVRNLLERYGEAKSREPEFLWKIVVEDGNSSEVTWPPLAAFSEEGLRYVSVGHRSFMALDLEGHEAVGFLSKPLAEDEPGLASVFLSTLFDLTAASLNLTMIPAGCVSLGENGLLLFGPPESGKTTSGYLARKLGLEYRGDQATFLEMRGRELRAWGQFWPAAFRTGAESYLPELRGVTRPLQYAGMTFLTLAPGHFPPPPGTAVKPVASVFLERRSADAPRLLRLSGSEFGRRLQANWAFKEDRALERQRSTISDALTHVPAYRLLYGEDPAQAAVFLHGLLSAHSLLED